MNNVPSTFGWLDTDTQERSGMLDVIDLFRERGTLDELGIGGIRDALSNTLFPGTSTLHSRLRYVLFIPWLLQAAADRATSNDEMRSEFASLEGRLVQSLLAGGETEGVIGRVAGDRLVQKPSGMYWAALGSWGVRNVGSIDELYQRRRNYKALRRMTIETDDPGAREPLPSQGLDPRLPTQPSDLLEAATFDLTPPEADYLTDRMTESTRGTAFAWLIDNPPISPARFVWEIENLDAAPAEARREIDHARRFSYSIRGATILYHLIIAEKADRHEHVEIHRDQLAEWHVELEATAVLRDWDRADWWALIGKQNPRITQSPTQRFVDDWMRLASAPGTLAENHQAREMIVQRERRIKGSRAPLANQSALDRWGTGKSIGAHTFRWEIAQSHIRDLNTGRSA